MTKSEAMHLAFSILKSKFDPSTGLALSFTEDDVIQIAEKLYKYANS